MFSMKNLWQDHLSLFVDACAKVYLGQFLETACSLSKILVPHCVAFLLQFKFSLGLFGFALVFQAKIIERKFRKYEFP